MGLFTKEELSQIKEYCRKVLETFMQRPISIELVWVMVIYLGQYILYANPEISDKDNNLLKTGEKILYRLKYPTILCECATLRNSIIHFDNIDKAVKCCTRICTEFENGITIDKNSFEYRVFQYIGINGFTLLKESLQNLQKVDSSLSLQKANSKALSSLKSLVKN